MSYVPKVQKAESKGEIKLGSEMNIPSFSSANKLEISDKKLEKRKSIEFPKKGSDKKTNIFLALQNK